MDRGDSAALTLEWPQITQWISVTGDEMVRDRRTPSTQKHQKHRVTKAESSKRFRARLREHRAELMETSAELRLEAELQKMELADLRAANAKLTSQLDERCMAEVTRLEQVTDLYEDEQRQAAAEFEEEKAALHGLFKQQLQQRDEQLLAKQQEIASLHDLVSSARNQASQQLQWCNEQIMAKQQEIASLHDLFSSALTHAGRQLRKNDQLLIAQHQLIAVLKMNCAVSRPFILPRV